MLQGNQFTGNLVTGGPARGDSATIGFYFAGRETAWDSNQFDIGSVIPGPSSQYALLHTSALSNRLVLK